jgi:class 3 adenylate cyclase
MGSGKTMKDIHEATAATSPCEILVHLNDKIMAGELRTFESLLAYVSAVQEHPQLPQILKRAAELQRRIYWGFFRQMTPQNFPGVWSKTVIMNRKFPFAGDLKRFVTITDLYVGMLDIHGYTRFCHRNRHNMSMLDLLDRMMQEDIPKIAAAAGVMSRRARGDEILLLGPSAGDLLGTALAIIGYFSKKQSRNVDAAVGAQHRMATSSLPEFQISAGIAGGEKYAQLVITRDGDLSGSIINSAARLQARANKISPDRNKILVTNHVVQRLKANGSCGSSDMLKTVEFFNCGTVDFKGLSLHVFDTVFMETEAYRLGYRDVMEELYEAMGRGLWKSKVFEASMNLAARVVSTLPQSLLKGKSCPDVAMIDTNDLLFRIKAANAEFAQGDFERAVETFGGIIGTFEQIDCLDDLVLEYLAGVYKSYARLIKTFTENLDHEIEDHLDLIYSPVEKENLAILRKHYQLYQRANEAGRGKVRNRKAIWFRIAEEAAPSLRVRVVSKK